MNDFISNIITEAALDPRIQDGMIDIKNADHIQVIAELIYDACDDEKIVNEFVQTFMEEGKYPERQAYNKDGWLVTFPSKEYRDAAIKKRTHFTSDPTHGKGGMNLYYKKKGKQKRQTQQAATQTKTDATVVGKPSQPTEKPTQAPTPTQGQERSSTDGGTVDRAERLAKLTGKKEPTTPSEPASQPADSDKQKERPIQPKEKEPSLTAPSGAPAIDVPVVTTPPEEYATVSKKFATQKGWTVTEYGEYRDAEGNPVAVVGLSGEVVPIRSNDREEYKIFAEKSKA